MTDSVTRRRGVQYITGLDERNRELISAPHLARRTTLIAVLAMSKPRASFSVGRHCNQSYMFPVGTAGAGMIGLRKPRRRWWGWLVAIAYLLASMTPSLAISISLDVVMQCDHPSDQPGDAHEHDHAGGSAVHSHDVAMAGDCDDDDHDRPGERHATCCGSVLCFSAVWPQAPAVAEFVVPRSRCEAPPDVIGDEGTFRRHYRPPIA